MQFENGIRMNIVHFTEQLLAGRLLVGTQVASPSPLWPSALDGIGLDFVFLDTEHIPVDRMTLSWMCQTFSYMGLPPLVRVPSPDTVEATKVLDGGAAGVIVPYVETADQVRALAGAVKFRPIKGQRLADRLRGVSFEPRLDDYVRRRNSSALILFIESVPALRALDEILAVPGVDGVLIGPHDLTCSLGVPEEYDHPEYLAACKTILTKARAAGIGAGVHWWGSVEEHARFVSFGANLVSYNCDLTVFPQYLRQEVPALKKLTSAGVRN